MGATSEVNRTGGKCKNMGNAIGKVGVAHTVGHGAVGKECAVGARKYCTHVRFPM